MRRAALAVLVVVVLSGCPTDPLPLTDCPLVVVDVYVRDGGLLPSSVHMLVRNVTETRVEYVSAHFAGEWIDPPGGLTETDASFTQGIPAGTEMRLDGFMDWDGRLRAKPELSYISRVEMADGAIWQIDAQ